MKAFQEVLEKFESHGWVLQRIVGNYRVFREPKEDFFLDHPSEGRSCKR